MAESTTILPMFQAPLVAFCFAQLPPQSWQTGIAHLQQPHHALELPQQ